MGPEPVHWQRVGPGSAPALAGLWARATARRSGLPPPDDGPQLVYAKDPLAAPPELRWPTRGLP